MTLPDESTAPLPEALAAFELEFHRFYAANYPMSRGQLAQDLFALFVHPGPGIYLDIGAAHPSHISNTKLLEEKGWNGVLVEPNPFFTEKIKSERKALLLPCAVTPQPTGPAVLEVAEDPEFSRLAGMAEVDPGERQGKRATARAIEVQTVDIVSVCKTVHAEFRTLDFVSLDVEGLEYDILLNFVFAELAPSVICVEHNSAASEQKISGLLESKGYVRTCRDISKWDAWFVREELIRSGIPRAMIDAEPVASAAKGMNVPQVARKLYESKAFQAAAALVEIRSRETRLDPGSLAILARCHFHLGHLEQCIQTCLALLDEADQASREIAAKHGVPVLKMSIEALQRRCAAELQELRLQSVSPPANGLHPDKLRPVLAEPHTLEQNKRYVDAVYTDRSGVLPPAQLPGPGDREGRAALAASGSLAFTGIERVENAGITGSGDGGGILCMFNGIRIPAAAFGAEWIIQMIEACKGHHEPQVEQAFSRLLGQLGDSPILLQTGARPAFFGAWLLGEKKAAARAVIVSPDSRALAAAMETMRLNGLEADHHFGRIGMAGPMAPTEVETNQDVSAPLFNIGKHVESLGSAVDVLLADFEDAEDRLLVEIAGCLARTLVKHVILLTSGMAAHLTALRTLSGLGFYIISDVDPFESFSQKGFIVARHGSLPPVGYIDVPRWNGTLTHVDPPALRAPGPPCFLFENTISAGERVKRELYRALERIGFDVCMLGERLMGDYRIPYHPDSSGVLACENPAGLTQIEHDGINLWDVCRGTAGYEIPDLCLESLSEPQMAGLQRLFLRAANFIDFLAGVLRKHRPVGAVTWGGTFIEPAIIAILCRRHRLPVFAIEFSFDPMRVHFDPSGRIGNDFSFNKRWDLCRGVPLDRSQEKSIGEWILGNYKGKSKAQPLDGLSESVRTFIGRHPDKPLLLLGQCYIDTVITYDNPHFRSTDDAYAEVIEQCAAKGIPLVVKSHPGDREEYKLRLRERCARHPGIYYVGLESDENVYHLMDACSAGITINSQAGLEMLAKRKPVLNLGRSFYGEAGMSLVLRTRGELGGMIDALVAHAEAGFEVNQECRAYLYRLLFEHLVDLSGPLEDTANQLAERISASTPGLLPAPARQEKSRQDPALRVVILHASPSWAGSGFYLQDLGMELQKRGHEVLILCEGTCAPYDRGVRWRRLDFDGVLLSRDLKQLVLDFAPNVVLEAGVRTKPMRAALEIAVATGSILVVHGEDDEFIPFNQYYPAPDPAILDALDKEIVTPGDLNDMLGSIHGLHAAKVFADPQFDRWVDPVLRSILYHKADRFTAIWKPMLERLEERFGKTGDLLPPVVRFEDFDLTPLEPVVRRAMLANLDLPQDSLVYFINGTIYRYSDESKVFVEALNLLQESHDKPIVLLALGELEMDSPPKFLFRALGRLGDEAYMQHVKLADVICAPGVPDLFNRYRLSSRLVKGMMAGKPIFTFKTGFAEKLADDLDGFFTHTGLCAEWVEVLKRTLSSEAREVAGTRGRAFAVKWFDAAAVAGNLIDSWQALLTRKFAPKRPKPVIDGILSESQAYRAIQRIYVDNVPYSLRHHTPYELARVHHEPVRFNRWTLLICGFASQEADGKTRYFARKRFTGIAISPHRRGKRVRLVLSNQAPGILVADKAFSIWSPDGWIASRQRLEENKLTVEFDSEASEFVILSPNRFGTIHGKKVFFELVEVDAGARATFAARAPGARETVADVVRQAVHLHRAGNFAKAETVLRTLVRHHPEHVPYRRALAEVLWAAGKRKSARNILRDALPLSARQEDVRVRFRQMSRHKLLRMILRQTPFDIESITAPPGMDSTLSLK